MLPEDSEKCPQPKMQSKMEKEEVPSPTSKEIFQKEVQILRHLIGLNQDCHKAFLMNNDPDFGYLFENTFGNPLCDSFCFGVAARRDVIWKWFYTLRRRKSLKCFVRGRLKKGTLSI